MNRVTLLRVPYAMCDFWPMVKKRTVGTCPIFSFTNDIHLIQLISLINSQLIPDK